MQLADLRPDCASCAGLCCVALPFGRAAGFGYDKPSGVPCRNLRDDDRCEIHAELRERGWPSCTVFECFGAGQRVTQSTFGRPAHWRTEPELAEAMFTAFAAMRLVHEIGYYLATLPEVDEPRADALRAEVDDLALAGPEALAVLDLSGLHRRAGQVLAGVSGRLREGVRPQVPRALTQRLRVGAELPGADLAGLRLDGAELRGALLIAADLSGARLRRTDLLGADLRDTRLHGADLSETLFVTQPQLNAALGDGATRLPSWLARPAHWRD